MRRRGATGGGQRQRGPAQRQRPRGSEIEAQRQRIRPRGPEAEAQGPRGRGPEAEAQRQGPRGPEALNTQRPSQPCAPLRPWGYRRPHSATADMSSNMN